MGDFWQFGKTILSINNSLSKRTGRRQDTCWSSPVKLHFSASNSHVFTRFFLTEIKLQKVISGQISLLPSQQRGDIPGVSMRSEILFNPVKLLIKLNLDYACKFLHVTWYSEIFQSFKD